jgi:hypothetical protein
VGVGGVSNFLRFMGSVRPRRLLPKLEVERLGRISGRTVGLVRKDFIGSQDVVMLDTSARTYFAEGLASHNCVEEMILHTIEMLHADNREAVPLFTKQDAGGLYEQMGGWKPAESEATDQGTDENVAMKDWEEGLVLSDGKTHTIEGTIAVNPKNPELVKRAIWEFVAPQFALEMPTTAQGQTRQWEVVAGMVPGSWGGHGVPGFSYDELRLRIGTWGGEMLMTWPFLAVCGAECHVVITKEMISTRTGLSPAGVNWTALGEAFAKLRGEA